MAGTLEDLPVSDHTGLASQSAFQLQTASIRNSTPFKAKSANIFGSLESIEKDYNSAVSERSLDTDGGGGAYDNADEEEGRLEGIIKRGCIFKKPLGSSGGLGQAGNINGQETGTHSGCVGLDKKVPSHSSTTCKSVDTFQSDDKHVKSTTTSTSLVHQEGPSSSKDNTAFRKPNGHRMSSEGKQDDSGRSRWRGRGRFDSNFAPRGRQCTADHLLNPQKYTKYSLEETNMCGNSANQSIALGFLSELRKRKMAEGEDQAAGEGYTKGQFVFKKPTSPSGAEECSDEQHSTKNKAYGSVYKMPEYEVGKSSVLKHKKPKMAYTTKDLEKTSEVECGSSPVFTLDHPQSELSITSKGHIEVDHSARSKISGTGEEAETEQSEHGEPACHEEASFKSRKGKGRRQFRGRREEDT